MKRNYQKELDQVLAQTGNHGKTLFLHSCCAPCSSYVLEYLRMFFHIIVFYFNPNITEEEEYRRRVEEQKKLIEEFNKSEQGYPILFTEGPYHPELFFQAIKGNEKCPEGGRRCEVCFRLRLLETAKQGAGNKCDFFATTLTISPMKNAELINQLGEELGAAEGIQWLPTDFKKKDGYKRSLELSKEYQLYRQNYCGCIYSKIERMEHEGGNT